MIKKKKKNNENHSYNLYFHAGGSTPVIMVLVNALPMAGDIIAKVYKYLQDTGLDTGLVNVYGQDCHYARNIVGFHNND